MCLISMQHPVQTPAVQAARRFLAEMEIYFAKIVHNPVLTSQTAADAKDILPRGRLLPTCCIKMRLPIIIFIISMIIIFATTVPCCLKKADILTV